jgi:trimethylamine:corrinoid methyltransferase-like protein
MLDIGRLNCFFKLEILEKEQIEIIDRTSRDILKEIGIRIPNRRILNVLGDCGAKIDSNNNIVNYS